ncbi:MAG: hypothetical protein QM779_13935 [Propionicimonas sp.]|uniref:hypothetical protein n=1 Tax=Propionicimonas sp. TaxID=1955623 RepID=UPI003D105338
MSDPVLVARSALARAHMKIGNRPPDLELIAELERDLRAAKLERHVREVMAAEPRLSSDQRQRLALLLLGGEGA